MPFRALGSRPALEQVGVDRRVLVWDLPTRLFHWLVVVLLIGAYVTWRLNWMDWHVRVGESLLALVLFRVVWGFLGCETARFGRFVAAPTTAARYLAKLFRREPDEQLGHNPAGGWMVVLLLALLLGETLTGIIDNNDVADVGPLTDMMPPWVSNLVTGLHGLLWNALLAAVALHVVAIAFYAVAKGQYLLPPMITGTKQFARSMRPPRRAAPVLALIALSGSAAVAALLATFL